MRKHMFAFLVCALVISSSIFVQAQDSMTDSEQLEIFTNKKSYHAGESGFIVLILDTYGMMDRAEIEVEVLSPKGHLVEGDILYTKIPEKTVVNPETAQTAQVIYNEGIHYFGPKKTIFRVIPFEVPLDVLTGNYTIAAKVSGDGLVLSGQTNVDIAGPGGFITFIFLAFMAVLLFSLYLLRRG